MDNAYSNTKQKSDTIIVVPAFNEELRLYSNYFKWKELLQKYQIILVDDGSKDGTTKVAKKIGFRVITLKENQGKGYAVRKGIIEALKHNPKNILFTDADLSVPPEEFSTLIQELKNNDIVIGSRHLKESNTKRSIKRKIISKVLNIILNKVLNLGIKDTQCGCKAFRSYIAEELFKNNLTFNRYGFDIEILVKARNRKYRIKEIPVTWIEDKDTKVNILYTIREISSAIIKLYRYQNML